MKKLTCRLITAIVAAALAASMMISLSACGSDALDTDGADENSTDVGTAPDFTVLDMEGNEVKLSDFRGKPVVLNFWTSWCFYCMVEMPDFEEARKAYPDVQFLMVNATSDANETIDDAKEFIRNKDFGFDYFFDVDGEAADAYRVTGYPMTVFIDRFGNAVAKGSGMLEYEMIVEGIGMIIA